MLSIVELVRRQYKPSDFVVGRSAQGAPVYESTTQRGCRWPVWSTTCTPGTHFGLAQADPVLLETLKTYGVLGQFDQDKIYPTILDVFTAHSAEQGVK